MTRVAVSESVLLWALERSGRTADLKQRFSKLSEWLAGESQPTMRQLEDLAKATATPFGYFFLAEPPVEQLPIPHFRTLDDDSPSRPSPDLLETVQTMQLRQDWMRDYLADAGHEPLAFIRSAKLGDDLQQIVLTIRETLGLEETWASRHYTWDAALRQLRRRIDNAGILVMSNGVVGNNNFRKLNPEEFRGFVLVDEIAPLVFLNGADGMAARMFTLAHELAHLWFGLSAAFDLREFQPADDAIEKACNSVAAEFLVPETTLCESWQQFRKAVEPFQDIARYFKVSSLVAARRALELELITRDEFLEFYRAYQNDERRNSGQPEDGGNFYPNQNLRVGRRFTEAIVGSVREGKLLYRDAYRLTGLHKKSFEGYADYLGLGALHE